MGAWWPSRSSKPLSARLRVEVCSIRTLSASSILPNGGLGPLPSCRAFVQSPGRSAKQVNPSECRKDAQCETGDSRPTWILTAAQGNERQPDVGHTKETSQIKT